MNLTKTFALAALIAATATAGSASAATFVTFTTAGVTEQVSFNGYTPNTTTVDPNLHGLMGLTLSSITNGGYTWNFSYTLDNTSTEQSRISVVGWDVDLDYDSVDGLAGLFGVAGSGNMASLGAEDLCLKDSGGGSNCSGGGSGGLTMGQSGSGVFSLTFASQSVSYTTVQTPKYNRQGKLTGYTTQEVPIYSDIAAPTSLTFSDFGVRYQSLAGGKSSEGLGDVLLRDTGHTTVDQIRDAVPEPATWALMILGFGAVGATLRRRRGRALAA